MSGQAVYKVQFWSGLPDPLKVGDEIRISGKATVRAISAECVDITGYGSDGTDIALDEITVDLIDNTIQVVQMRARCARCGKTRSKKARA